MLHICAVLGAGMGVIQYVTWWLHLLFIHDVITIFIVQQEVLYYLIVEMAAVKGSLI